MAAQHFTAETDTGYAVARLSYALGGPVAVVESCTLDEARRIAVRMNREAAQVEARVCTGPTVRRSVRSCLPDFCRE